MTPDPCHCSGPNATCHRAGVPMTNRRLWEHCSGQYPTERPCGPVSSEAHRTRWDQAAATPFRQAVETLLTDGVTKVYRADLLIIGGNESCTDTETAKLGITGDPGITLTQLNTTHPEIAFRAARWIAAGRPTSGKVEDPKIVLPTVAQQVATLAQEIDAWIAAGKPLCTQEQHDARKDLCAPCAYFQNDRCLACGCYGEAAPLLAKAFAAVTGRGIDVPGMWWMATKKCPLAEPKWLPIVSAKG